MIKFPVIYTDKKHGFLFVDPSSSHLAWCLAELDLDAKELYIAAVGMLWTSDKWTKGKRYKYMQQAIGTLVQGNKEILPNVAVTEAFFVNPKMMVGSAVIPTINAFLEMSCDTFNVNYQEIGPTTWRSILGIKPTKDAKGKRDYKVPTADLVSQYIQLPETIESNINRKQRQLPHDVTDVLAIALAVAKHHGITKVTTGNVAFNPNSWITIFEIMAKELL